MLSNRTKNKNFQVYSTLSINRAGTINFFGNWERGIFIKKGAFSRFCRFLNFFPTPNIKEVMSTLVISCQIFPKPLCLNVFDSYYEGAFLIKGHD